MKLRKLIFFIVLILCITGVNKRLSAQQEKIVFQYDLSGTDNKELNLVEFKYFDQSAFHSSRVIDEIRYYFESDEYDRASFVYVGEKYNHGYQQATVLMFTIISTFRIMILKIIRFLLPTFSVIRGLNSYL